MQDVVESMFFEDHTEQVQYNFLKQLDPNKSKDMDGLEADLSEFSKENQHFSPQSELLHDEL